MSHKFIEIDLANDDNKKRTGVCQRYIVELQRDKDFGSDPTNKKCLALLLSYIA